MNPWDPVPIGNTFVRQASDNRLVLQPVSIPLELPTLLGGATGAGKSGVLHALLAGAAYRPMVQFVILDPKAMEFPRWQWGDRAACIASGVEACKHVLNLLYDEKERRKHISARQHRKRWVPSVEEPWIVVVFDEIAELTFKGPSGVIGVLQSLLATVRAAGIFMLDATQRPDVDVLPGTLRDNHRVRICLGTESADGTKMVLGPEGAKLHPCHMIPESQAGRGVVRVDRKFTEFRSFFISDERIEQVVSETARLRRDLAGFPPHLDLESALHIDETPKKAPARGRRTAATARK